MPRICDFLGMAIYMHFNEGSHMRPHFHVEYGEYLASVDFVGAVLEGALPRRQQQLIRKWVGEHQDELARNWALARAGQPLDRIAPLS